MSAGRLTRAKSTLARVASTAPKSPFVPWVPTQSQQQLPLYDRRSTPLLTLNTLLKQLPRHLRDVEERPAAKISAIKHLLRRVNLSPDELERFALSMPEKAYTRSVVATDKLFSLLCLVWTPGSISCIHDHPSAGCWVRVLSGSLEERQYRRGHLQPAAKACGGSMEKPPSAPLLEETKRTLCKAGDVTYIDDSIGLHNMANPSLTQPAVTLHLYSPEYKSCTVWSDAAAVPEERGMTYDFCPTDK